MKYFYSYGLFVGLFFVLINLAHADTATDKKNITKKLQSVGVQINNMQWVPSLNMFEVPTGQGVFYIDKKGNNFIVGNWYSFDEQQALVNETSDRKVNTVLLALAKVDKKELITYAAIGKTKEELYIFTDPNCPYCKKMHKEIPTLNKAGVTVHYLFLPIIKKASMQDSINVWCAKNQTKALDDLKNNVRIPTLNCENPIEKHKQLGISLGISGTPFTVAKKSRKSFAGYVKSKDLLKAVGL